MPAHGTAFMCRQARVESDDQRGRQSTSRRMILGVAFGVVLCRGTLRRLLERSTSALVMR